MFQAHNRWNLHIVLLSCVHDDILSIRVLESVQERLMAQ